MAGSSAAYVHHRSSKGRRKRHTGVEQKPVSLRIRPRRCRAKTKQTSPSVRRKRQPRPSGLRNGVQFHGGKEELRDRSRIASREETLDPTKILTARVIYDKVKP
ncbi:hypothetical protein TR75_10955 [Hydrogenibacillus schlegelii]|nr:hypothetical protein TR75_10955 [Hydrogenibacillus schlegelii]